MDGLFPNTYDISMDWIKDQVEKGVPNGLFCTDVDECVPVFDRAPCEKSLYGEQGGGHNNFIILGRDRDASWASGAGGRGYTACGMIDLVVGRLQLVSAKKGKPVGVSSKGNVTCSAPEAVGPNFAADAARVYITQKCINIDEYFGFSKTQGPESFMKSAVAIKADHTRIIGRESVRIYAGRGRFEGFNLGLLGSGETTCTGSKIRDTRVDIIGTGQEKDLEPAVKGYKLANYMQKVNDSIRELQSELFKVHRQLALVNGTLATVAAAAAAGAPQPAMALLKNATENSTGMFSQFHDQINTYLEEAGSLDTMVIKGTNSILSNTVYIT